MRTRTLPASIGQDRDLVTVEAPGPAIPDGEGGYTYTWTQLSPPTWYVRLRPATARDAEQLTAGTVLTHVSYIIHGRYHPGVTTACRLIDADGEIYQVTSVIDLDHRGTELEVVADRQD